MASATDTARAEPAQPEREARRAFRMMRLPGTRLGRLIIALNLNAAFHTTRLAVPYMKERSWGRIIQTASAHSLVASPFKSAYVTAKHGLAGFTKTIALVLSDITNPFFTTIARGVEDVAGPRGFGVMFCNTDEDPGEEMDYLQMLTQRQVDGVLLVHAGSATCATATASWIGVSAVP